MKDGYLSGAALRQYLHISTRKLKYLMDYNYIPHENTGHSTHKYMVRIEDAERFKQRMDSEEGFLRELTGLFNSRHPAALPKKEPTKAQRAALKRQLTKLWAAQPDALPVQTAASLAGVRPQRIYDLLRNGKLHGAKIGTVQYCVKDEVIAWLAER